MYLSKVKLNPYRRDTVKAIDSPQVIHAAVMSAFDSCPDRGRVLWRTDRVGDSLNLLIVSGGRPDIGCLVDRFGYPEDGDSWKSLPYDGILDGLCEGQYKRFRLRANPVRSIMSKSSGSRGKPVALTTPGEQMDWLRERTDRYGFVTADAGTEPELQVVQKDTRKFIRRGKMVTINTATFQGVLCVTDAENFRKALTEGIGRAKAYGCGLLTVSDLQINSFPAQAGVIPADREFEAFGPTFPA